jgi:hypothetical protein
MWIFEGRSQEKIALGWGMMKQRMISQLWVNSGINVNGLSGAVILVFEVK